MTAGKSNRPALGTNPLAQGIFNKTDNRIEPQQAEVITEAAAVEAPQTSEQPDSSQSSLASQQEQPISKSTLLNQDSVISNQDSVISNQDSQGHFLVEEATERVNLRLSMSINDWLDDLLKQGKRKHGRKIPKEVWIQASLELFRTLPVKWEEIDSVEKLQEQLLIIESRFNNQDSIIKIQ